MLWERRAEPLAAQSVELRHLVEVRTVHHHYREWALVCTYDEALGANHTLSEPEVMVSELMERLRSIGLQIEVRQSFLTCLLHVLLTLSSVDALL